MKYSWVGRNGVVRVRKHFWGFFFVLFCFFEQLMRDIFKEISINSSESSF